MFNRMKLRLCAFTGILFLVLLGGSALVPPRAAAAPNLTGVTKALIDLLNQQDTTKITAEDYKSTSLHQIITFETPAGYRIKLRYLDFGMALVEALKIARDPELRRRMIEMVQWTRDPKVRAEAIITLASLLDPSHKKYFKEAILDSKVGIRFSAVEALLIWNQPESIPLLKMAMDRDFSPLMRVYTAQALLALDDQSGLDVLWKGLDSESWVIRSTARRLRVRRSIRLSSTRFSAISRRVSRAARSASLVESGLARLVSLSSPPFSIP